MILLKTAEEIEKLRASNQLVSKTLGELAKMISHGNPDLMKALVKVIESTVGKNWKWDFGLKPSDPLLIKPPKPAEAPPSTYAPLKPEDVSVVVWEPPEAMKEYKHMHI